MTETELKKAMNSMQPVISGGVIYRRVAAIQLEPNIRGGGVLVSGILADKSGRSTTKALASHISLIDKKGQAKPAQPSGYVGMCSHCMQPVHEGQELYIRQGGKLFHSVCVENNPWGKYILEEKRLLATERKNSI